MSIPLICLLKIICKIIKYPAESIILREVFVLMNVKFQKLRKLTQDLSLVVFASVMVVTG